MRLEPSTLLCWCKYTKIADKQEAETKDIFQGAFRSRYSLGDIPMTFEKRREK